MPWKQNKSEIAHEFPDLRFLPLGRSTWDCTLSSLAYGVRMDFPGALPDLNAWAARHGLPGSKLYTQLGESALVLWHGTSRNRAEEIAKNGLFHKKGLWTARHPKLPHSFCRRHSERSGTEGAVVCLVLDHTQLVEGRDFETETNGNVLRFQHGLPPDVVQYILFRDNIRFTGATQDSQPKPWRKARFKHTSGQWIPVQKVPVRFSESRSFSTLQEFVSLNVSKLFNEFNGISPLEVLSVLYSLVDPWNSLQHTEIIDLLGSISARTQTVGKWKIFMPSLENNAD